MQNEMSEFVSLLAEEKKRAAILAEEKRRIEEEKEARLTPRVEIGSSLSEFFATISEGKKSFTPVVVESVEIPQVVESAPATTHEEKVDILKTFFGRLDDFEQKLEEAAFAAVPPKEVPNAMQQMADRISKVVPDSAKPKPMDEMSVLARDFKVFKEIVTRQLASMTAGTGGGGSANFFDLNDIDTSTLGDGKFLVYNATSRKLEFTDQVDGN